MRFVRVAFLKYFVFSSSAIFSRKYENKQKKRARRINHMDTARFKALLALGDSPLIRTRAAMLEDFLYAVHYCLLSRQNITTVEKHARGRAHETRHRDNWHSLRQDKYSSVLSPPVRTRHGATFLPQKTFVYLGKTTGIQQQLTDAQHYI